MSQKANPTVIGVFVVGAVALAVIGILSFGGGALLAEKVNYVMFFEGSSLKGLDIGAPVNFQGVRIGSVTDIVLKFDPKTGTIRIPVYAEIERQRIKRSGQEQPAHPYENARHLIDRGLRAQLELQSFVTGKLAIQLDFYPDSELRYVGTEDRYLEIPTIPSKMEELTETIENLPIDELVSEMRSAINGFDELVRSPDLKKAITDADEMILEFKALAHDVNERVGSILSEATETSKTIRQSFAEADKKVASAVEVFNETLTTYKKLAADVDEQVNPLSESLQQSLAELRTSLEKLNAALDAVTNVLAEDSAFYHRLNYALEQAATALRSLRVLVDLLERHPEALIQGKRP